MKMWGTSRRYLIIMSEIIADILGFLYCLMLGIAFVTSVGLVVYALLGGIMYLWEGIITGDPVWIILYPILIALPIFVWWTIKKGGDGFMIPVFSTRLDAGEIMVVQSYDGRMVWYTTPGRKWRGFGKVTRYPVQEHCRFSEKSDHNNNAYGSIQIRFNDGVYARISGSLIWQMPRDTKALVLLHENYGDSYAIREQVLRTFLERSFLEAASVISARESYVEKRNDFLLDIRSHCVRKTESGIVISELTINDIKYDEGFGKQIKLEFDTAMQVQLAIARAKEAEQEAISAERRGEARAAAAKWEQEAIKVKAVIEAAQKLEVAKIEAEAAEHAKLAEIRHAQAEAERIKLTMEANGTREKWAAYIKVNEAYAKVLEGYKGSLVPSVMMGDMGDKGGSGLLELLSLKIARDLGLEMDSSEQKGT